MSIKLACAALYPITRYGFPYSLDNYLKAVAELSWVGFGACELEINVDLDLQEYVDRQSEVVTGLSKHRMTLSAIIVVLQGGFSMNAQLADRHLALFEQACGFGRSVGCDNMCICAYMPPEIKGVPGSEAYRGSPPLQIRVPEGFEWPTFWANAVHRFSLMAASAARYGQNLIIENRVGDFVSTSDGILKLIDDASAANAGCLLDLAHSHATKEHFDLIIPKLQRRLAYVHLADNDGSYSYHLPAGCGNIDFPAVLRSLRAIGFHGCVAVNYGGVSADRILAEVSRGRQYFATCLEAIQ